MLKIAVVSLLQKNIDTFQKMYKNVWSNATLIPITNIEQCRGRDFDGYICIGHIPGELKLEVIRRCTNANNK